MKASLLYIAILMMSVCLDTYAQEQQHGIDTIALPEVKISDSRLAMHNIIDFKNDTVAGSLIIGKKLSNIITGNFPYYFKIYGMGLFASISLRGGRAAHTKVYWNDFDITNPMTGITDVSLLYAGDNTLVSIDPVSPDSPGGKIDIRNILTKKDKTTATVSASSLQNINLHTSLALNKGKILQNITAGFYHNKNKFYFHKDNNRVEIRNSGAIEKNIGYTASRTFNNNRIDFFLSLSQAHREIPPSRYESFSDAFQDDDIVRAGMHYIYTQSKLSLKLKGGYFYHNLVYDNNSKNIFSDSKIHTFQAGLQAVYILRDFLKISTRIDEKYYKVLSTVYNVSGYHNLDVLTAVQYTVLPGLKLNLDIHSVFDTHKTSPFNPVFSLEYNAFARLKMNISAGYKVHLPGFNDLYWPQGGNPDLKAENSGEVNMQMGYHAGAHRYLQVAFYRKTITDMISWLPSGGLWYAANMEKTQIQGLEIAAAYRLAAGKTAFTLTAVYNHNESKITDVNSKFYGKRLIYTPGDIITASFLCEYNTYLFKANWHYTSAIFTTADNQDKIPAWDVADIIFSKKYKIPGGKDLIFTFIIKNILDEHYETVKNYPLPGRYFDMGIKIIF